MYVAAMISCPRRVSFHDLDLDHDLDPDPDQRRYRL
jgi:hypothetical protein